MRLLCWIIFLFLPRVSAVDKRGAWLDLRFANLCWYVWRTSTTKKSLSSYSTATTFFFATKSQLHHRKVRTNDKRRHLLHFKKRKSAHSLGLSKRISNCGASFSLNTVTKRELFLYFNLTKTSNQPTPFFFRRSGLNRRGKENTREQPKINERKERKDGAALYLLFPCFFCAKQKTLNSFDRPKKEWFQLRLKEKREQKKRKAWHFENWNRKRTLNVELTSLKRIFLKTNNKKHNNSKNKDKNRLFANQTP